MSNEITTQQVADRVTDTQSLNLNDAEKAKVAARRNSALAQAKTNTQTAEKESASAQQSTDTNANNKVIAQEAVDVFDKFVKEVQVDLKYEVNDETDEVVIKFYEKGTDKLIRQIPPDAILNLKQRINDLLGIIYDETA